jgi:hypothetical protein
MPNLRSCRFICSSDDASIPEIVAELDGMPQKKACVFEIMRSYGDFRDSYLGGRHELLAVHDLKEGGTVELVHQQG